MTIAQGNDTPSLDSEERPRQSKLLGNWFRPKIAEVATPNIIKQSDLELNLSALKDLRISSIAIPKADIVAIPIDASSEVFFEALREHGYSRMPVFKESLDDPVGLLHVKDIFMTHGLDLSKKELAFDQFVRPLIYVPPSMRVITLLQKMQSEHVHMALVIDEFGGVDGLITIEDILEQIVGDITDEHDETSEALWVMEREGVYLAQSRTLLSEFERDAGVSLPTPENEDGIDTIGGLIMTLISRVPAKGELIKSEDGHEFEIVEADPRRIKKIRIRVPLVHSDSDL